MHRDPEASYTSLPNLPGVNWQTLFLKLKHIKIPHSWQVPIVIFILGRVLFSVWGVIIWLMGLTPLYKGPFYFGIEPVLNGAQGMLLGMWQRWDSIHYQQIAMSGYINDALTAFFPLFPLLGRWVSFITGKNALLGLIIVSNAATLLALWLLYQITSEAYSPELAAEALLCVIIFPSSFFLYAVYPQSLLLMFILLAYWLAHHDQWVWAGVASLGAGLTHSTAVILTPLLAWVAWRSLTAKKNGNKTAMLVAPFMNLLGIGVFLAWRNLAGFSPYQAMLREIWARTTTMPWDGLVAVARSVIHLPLDPIYFMGWINIFAFVLMAGLTLWSIKKIAIEMWIYQAVLMIMLLSTSVSNDPLLGVLRYSLVMFPLFIELAMIGNTRGWRLLKFAVFLLLSLVCSAWFFMWKFVA